MAECLALKLLLLLLVWLCRAGEGQISSGVKDNPVCLGVFDFYFVLDGSGSVTNEFHTEIVPFVENVTQKYVEPDFRFSMVTFASAGETHLNLTRTAEMAVIDAGIASLKAFSPGGGTRLALGLQLVNEQIRMSGGDASSVVLVLTDGQLSDLAAARTEADAARTAGARIFTIGIGEVDASQLALIADSEEQVFIGSNFTFLDEILAQIVNKTCIEILSVFPSVICTGSTETLILSGRGFTSQPGGGGGREACRFRTTSDELFLTFPSEPVTADTIVCPVPDFNGSDTLLLQVTINGISFISSNVTLQTKRCTAASSVVAGMILSLLGLIALVGLLALWCFVPLMTGKIVGGLPPEPKEERPKGSPGRKWDVVDASLYGGGGAGGIKPVTVRWGEKGATEEGSKLQKAKDAGTVEVKRMPGRAAPTPPHSPGCWQLTLRKLRRWYAVAASYRPVRGPNKHILWFPGRNTGRYTAQA